MTDSHRTNSVNVAVIYYSATGAVYRLAEAAAQAADKAGALVRLRKVRELAPDEAIASNAGWAEHRLQTQDIPEAALDDLEWADVLLFGTPTRYGLPTAQLKQFIDATGPLWAAGKLVNKVASSFTSAATRHGGQETTITALNNTYCHWGCIIVPPGYADPIQFQAGNPYGASHISNNGAVAPGETELASIEFQTRRTIEVAAALHGQRPAPRSP
jgi:NAD(P)H dehydrogenase (quinone)